MVLLVPKTFNHLDMLGCKCEILDHTKRYKKRYFKKYNFHGCDYTLSTRYALRDTMAFMKTQILFDNDGVLVDTEHWYYTASAEILSSKGFHLSPDRYRDIMIAGESAFLIAEEAGVPISETDQWRVLRNNLYQHYLKTEDIAIPGVQEVLAKLSDRYRMGIVTSALRCDFELIHASRGIVEYMDFVLCSGDYPRAKPHPDPYLLGLKRLGGEKHETIIVEDSQRGLRSAVAAGIECVIVHNRFTQSHDFSTATHRIQTLNELVTLLH